MTTGIRGAGDFCWINMLTPDPAAARAFFGSVLGWTYAEMPGMGHRVQVGGKDIGGLFDLHGPNTPPGTPPYIGVMIKVANADAACESVRKLGGKARPPFDIMEQGRMAVCFDPNGVEFDLWEPKRMQGTEVDSTLPGAPTWFEAVTTDVDRAAAFYTGLFGWTREDRAGNTFFKLEGRYVAETMAITPDLGDARPSWITYFTVRNVDQTVRQATGLGATICVPARDLPQGGRFAGLVSPQGVVFFVMGTGN